MAANGNHLHTTVILPVYNGERYLHESIESVVSQSFNDFEFLIWDDCSTDSSNKIIDGYRNPRVRIFRNTRNLGLFATLNLAIAESKGEWIRLWSQDDVMKFSCLEEEAAFVASRPGVGMAYCGWDTIDENGDLTATMYEDPTPELISSELAAQIMLYHGSITGNIANVRIKRKALEAVGLFREDMRISGDFEMWVRLSARYPIGFLRSALINLRSHKGQFSRQAGSYLTSILEDQEIYQCLLKRMPPEVHRYALKYHRYARQSRYVQCMARCIAAGNWKGVRELYRATNGLDNKFLTVAFYWLLTVNQHLYKMRPRYAAS